MCLAYCVTYVPGLYPRGALKFAREMPLKRVVELHEHLGWLIAVENGTQPVKLDDPGQPAGGCPSVELKALL